MAGYNNAPDLVVAEIIRALIEIETAGPHLLTLLAVCSTWRRVGLPIIYKEATMLAFANANINPYNGSPEDLYITNIGLLRSIGQTKLVRRLKIRLLRDQVSCLQHLKPFVKIFSPVQVEWLNDYDTHLPAMLDDIPNDSNRINSSIVRSEIRDRVRDVLVDFAREFPNISQLEIVDNNIWSFSNMELAEMFVSGLISSLNGLSFLGLSPLGLTHFPPSLTKLEYYYCKAAGNVVPKLNLQPLEELTLDQIPNGDLWESLRANLADGIPTTFPNLKYLGLIYNASDQQNQTNATSQHKANRILMKCPRLSTLYINSGRLGELDLSALEIPPHMDMVHLEICQRQVQQISKLPLNSVGRLVFNLSAGVFDNEFYQATNHLLGKIKNPKGTKVGVYAVADSLKYWKMDWRNVTNLEIYFFKVGALMSIVSRMPALKYMLATTDNGNDWESELPSISNNSIERLDLHFIGSQPSTTNVKCVIDMLKMLRALATVGLTYNFRDKVQECVNESASECLHLKHVVVTKPYLFNDD